MPPHPTTLVAPLTADNRGDVFGSPGESLGAPVGNRGLDNHDGAFAIRNTPARQDVFWDPQCSTHSVLRPPPIDEIRTLSCGP